MLNCWVAKTVTDSIHYYHSLIKWTISDCEWSTKMQTKIHLYESTKQKMTYIKKYVTRSTSSTITVLNSWTRVENRLISSLEYVLLLRVLCFLRSNHHRCHQATALSSGGRGGTMGRGESLSSTLSPSHRPPGFQFFPLPRFPKTQRGFCQK